MNGCLFALVTACGPSAPAASPPVSTAPKLAAEYTSAVTASEPTQAQHVCPASGEACEPKVPRAAAQVDGSQLFGAMFAKGVPEVTLSTLLAEPERYAGKDVTTQGTISRVCKAAGCWMELSDGSAMVRAPMAGHAFALPQQVIGRSAQVQGTLNLRALTEAQKEHLRAEGALVTSSRVSVVAKSVLVLATGSPALRATPQAADK